MYVCIYIYIYTYARTYIYIYIYTVDGNITSVFFCRPPQVLPAGHSVPAEASYAFFFIDMYVCIYIYIYIYILARTCRLQRQS